MEKIKFIETGEITEVSAAPKWSDGMWDCGDRRFMDPQQTLYQAVPTFPTLTPIAFYLAFTPTEMIAIKGSTDPMVREFYARYQLAAQLNHPIDPNIISVQEGLAYLATQTTATPAGPGILASSTRVTQILAGIAQ